MDWGLLNAIGITLMAVAGLWILEREHRKSAGRRGAKDKEG